MAISGVNGAGRMPGPAITRANQAFGSGRNWSGAWLRPRGRASSPTSQAETGETRMPPDNPAATIASAACGRSLSPFASQMTAQVSSRTEPGVAVIGAIVRPPHRMADRERERSGRFPAE